MQKLVPVSDLFEVRYGVNLELINLEIAEKLSDDAVLFVSRTENNNGVSAIVKRIPDVDPIPAGTLSVAGGGSVLATFVQFQPYYSGRDLYYLTPKLPMSERELVYFAMCIRKNKYRYSYGRQANRTLKHIRIPEKMPAEFEKLPVKIPSTKPVSAANIRLTDRKWKWFIYGDLFDFKKGKRLTKDDMVDGDLPFIGSTESDNGVTENISVPEGMGKYIHPDNVLTVTYNGSVGEAFYQPIPFWASDDVNVLYPKFLLNPFAGLFLCTVIRREKYRFNYGRKWHLERMCESKIKLPVTPGGTPDWKFMEDFIKSLPYSAAVS